MPQIMANANETTAKLFQKKKVMKAISVLKSLNEKFVQEELKKQPLFDETSESPVYLQVMLKKIPPSKLLQMIKFDLPHSLITETSEICLITGDLDKRNHKAEIEPVVMHYKDLLKKHGVTVVNEVIPLRQLRTEYKTFESKIQLVSAYDVFLVEKKIAGVMPKVLGKSFFHQRKLPVQINIKTSNLKSQIEKALSQTQFSLTCRGNSYAFEVARLSMEDSAILENIMSTVKVLADKLPGKWDNVFGIYLKTARSKAIPIYISFGNPNEVTLRKLRKKEKAKFQELSTISNAQVKILRDGRIILRKKREVKSVDDEETVENHITSLINDDLHVVDENTEDSDENNTSLKVKDEKDFSLTEAKIAGTSDGKKMPSKHKKRKSSANVDTSDNEANIKSEKKRTIEQEEYQGDSVETSFNSPKSKKYIQKELNCNDSGIKKNSSKRKSMKFSVSNDTEIGTEISEFVNKNKTPLKSRKSKILENEGINESEESPTKRKGMKGFVSNETNIFETVNENKTPLKSRKSKILKNEGIIESEEPITKKRKSMKGSVSNDTEIGTEIFEYVNKNRTPLKRRKSKILGNEGIIESEESATKKISSKRKSMKGSVSNNTENEKGVVEIVNKNETPLKSKKCEIWKNKSINENEMILKSKKNKSVLNDESKEGCSAHTPSKSRKSKNIEKENGKNGMENELEVVTGKDAGTTNKTPLKIRKSTIMEKEGINESEYILKCRKKKVVGNDKSLEDGSLKTPLGSKRNKDIKNALMESSTKSKNTDFKY